MNRIGFCSLLPHGSAVRYSTPGRVWIALSGLAPGWIFWISAPARDTAERVEPLALTITVSRLLGLEGSVDAAVAGTFASLAALAAALSEVSAAIVVSGASANVYKTAI